MEVNCINGHIYDSDIYAECPHCAQMGNAYAGADAYSKTVPLVWQTPNPGIGRTEPVNPAGSVHWADQDDYRKTTCDDYDPTIPKDVDQESIGAGVVRPVTGWLVCIDGPSKGQDYRLHAEYNYIGRSAKMDVSIQNDPTISADRHAVLAYDTQEQMFSFGPFSGGSLVRVNGKSVLNSTELKPNDRIQIGKSTFLFVAFCGEQFQW